MTSAFPEAYSSASEYLRNLFSTYLDVDPLVADWAYDRLSKDALTADEVMRELRYGSDSSARGQAAHAAYIARYPKMKELLTAGKLPWAPGSSPEQVYQEYENTIRSLTQRYGLNASFATRENISNYLINDMSAAEASDRMQLASRAVHQMPAEVRQLFKSYYGINEQDLTAYYLDPVNQAPILERKSSAVQLAGEGITRGVQISAAKAEWLAAMQITPDKAAQAFANVAARFGLEYASYGESVGRSDMVDAAFGQEAAARKTSRVEQSRKSAFQQSGSGAATTNQGSATLGTAET